MIRIELTAPHAVGLATAEDVAEVLSRRDLLSSYMLPIQNAGVLSRLGRDMLSCAHTTADNDKVVSGYERFLGTLA